MPTPSLRRLARLFTATTIVAVLAAGALIAWPSNTGHPPERIALTGRAVPINPTALPAIVVPATSTSTTSTTTPAPRTVQPATFVPKPTPPIGASDVTAAIAAHFDTGELYNQAARVADCESSLDPNAVSPDGANWGLFQINRVHRADFEAFAGRSWNDAIFDADANAAYARHLYDQQGWTPWACRP